MCKNNMFRLLTAGEIECRVAQAGKSGERVWCSVLIFKDARVDQRVLDETVGPMNWKVGYAEVDGKIYCTVSIWDGEKKEWISKQNVGVESNTEKEKGQASDALKRACFTWGLGVELYSSPKIFIDLKDGEYSEKDGKIKCRAEFFVRTIGYDENRVVNDLVIIDRHGNVRYNLNAGRQPQPSTPVTTPERNNGRVNVYTAADGKFLYEGGVGWNKAAQRVARGETCDDGTPLPVMMQEYYNIPDDAMNRFFALVNEIKGATGREPVSPSYQSLING